MAYTVLVQGAGSGGGNNVIRSLRESGLDLRILGSNCLPQCVAKSTASETFHLPESSKEGYLEALQTVVRRERVDLVIPQNEREVAQISKNRHVLDCQVFLPSHDVVETCQDKWKFFQAVSPKGIKLAPSVALETLENLDEAFQALPPGDRFWVRLRRGSGSKGATWVKTPGQAADWIRLWTDLRGYQPSDFQICSFLPGRDYAFQSVWKDGRLVVAKLCERLAYFMGALRLSGMSSTPEIARTLRDESALETIFATIHALTDHPHGNFCMDLKGDANGVMHITEVNIGRFCMITTIFDQTGQINTAEAYVRSAMNLPLPQADPIDIDEGHLLIRELDTEPLVIHESKLKVPLA